MPLLSEYTQGYLGYLAVLCLICTVVVIRSRKKDKVIVTKDFRKFQRGYLIVYFIAMMSDWLQGPYVYALYASYGFSRGDIAFLFIAGFGSSMIFGTIVGSFADRYGRRFNCLMFGALYGVSCITKHFQNYSILLVGRLLGGVATSILFSAFESWMVAEHKTAAFPEEWLSHTFASMTFGNGIVAIVSGIIASAAAGMFGFVAPFDVALICLIFGTGVIYTTWKENYGDKNAAPALNLKQGFEVLQNNPKVALLGIIQSCFESCMYIFVFMWTPILEQSTPEGEKLPHGLVFASFMVSMMVGSNIFKALMKMGSPEGILRYCYLAGAVCMATPVFSNNQTIVMISFCCFEFICGIYFPGMGVMRSQYIPEEVRATVMNLIRIGLNFIVVVVLNSIEQMRNESVFLLCIALLCSAALCQQYLFQATQGSKEEQAEIMAELQGQELPVDKLESGENGKASTADKQENVSAGKGE